MEGSLLSLPKVPVAWLATCLAIYPTPLQEVLLDSLADTVAKLFCDAELSEQQTTRCGRSFLTTLDYTLLSSSKNKIYFSFYLLVLYLDNFA